MKQFVPPESLSRTSWLRGKAWIIVGLGRKSMFLNNSPAVLFFFFFPRRCRISASNEITDKTQTWKPRQPRTDGLQTTEITPTDQYQARQPSKACSLK